MKKFLSLVLALVMTMSLVTISAGAKDFTDGEKITYKEAVDVMSAAGVIDGYTDGSFNPQGGLTRGAAAKIICNMILGPTTAAALSANDAPFKDVPADSTFAGYIAYCANEGIISGYADGTFRPSAPLTGYAFMKMLLGALGYDQDIEGYVGSNWSVQVAKRALNIGLNKGLEGTFVGSKALNREEAALYAFNTMKATMVEYEDNTQIIVGDVTISNKSKAEKVEPTKDTGKVKADGYEQFAEKYFTKLSLNEDDADKFGRPAHTWKYDKKKVGTYNDDPILVYTEEFKISDLIDDLDDEDYEVATKDPNEKDNDTTSFTFFTNGKSQEISYSDAKNIVDTKKLGGSDKFGGAGYLVEVYGDDDVVTKIVTVATYVAKVEKVVKDKASTKADESALELTVYDDVEKNDTTTYKLTANEDETDGFADVYSEVAKGDYVLVTPKNDNRSGEYAMTIAIPETVEGIVTRTATDTKVSIDGEVYLIAFHATKVQDLVANSKSEKTIILDAYGNAIYTPDVVADSADLVYVTNVFQEEDRYGETTTYAQVVHTDGEIEEIEVLKTMYGEDKGATYENTVCAYDYAKDDDDAYTLTVEKKDVVKMDGKNIKTSDAKISGTSNYYSEDVVFVYVNKSGAKLKVTTADGLQKITGVAENSYAVLNNDGDVIAVFVRSGASTAVDASDLAYVKSTEKAGTALDDDGKRQNTYKFYVNGEEFVEIAELDGVGFMNYSVDGVTYKFDAVDITDGAYNNVTTFTIGRSKYVTATVTVNEKDYTVTDATLAEDCEIYDLTDAGEITSLSDINDAASSLKISFMYDEDDNVITSLYVMDK